LGGCDQPILNRKWQISGFDARGVWFHCECPDLIPEDTTSKLAIIKKIPISATGSVYSDEQSWTRSTSILGTTYESGDFSVSVAPDSTNYFVRVMDVESETAYLKGNMKQKYKIFGGIYNETRQKNKVFWKCWGSPKQIYLVLGYARDDLYPQHLIVWGAVKSLISGEWVPCKQYYKIRQFGNPGFNHAVGESEWDILDSGYLVCRPKHDGRYTTPVVQIDKGACRNYGDSGVHMYPDPKYLG
jgi:hypothetical protein